MKLKDILKIKGSKYRITVTVGPEETVSAAIKKLIEHDRGSLPVCNDKGEMVGIITERDIVRKCLVRSNAIAKIKIQDVMSQQVIVGTPEDDLDYAISIMKEKRIRHIPIVDNKKVIGMISMRDLLGTQLEEYKMEVDCLGTVHEAAKIINSTLGTEEVLSTIVKVVAKETNAKGCSIMLLDVSNKTLEHKHTYGLSDEYLHKGVIMADSVLEDTMKGKPIMVSDVTKDPRIQYPTEVLKEGIASILSVPLNVKGKPLGVVRTYFPEKQEFSADTIKLLSAIADLSAIAITNARMYDSLKRANEVCRNELGYWQP
ncbi:CBS domain-containing protein [Chloroflexota bacterium]